MGQVQGLERTLDDGILSPDHVKIILVMGPIVPSSTWVQRALQRKVVYATQHIYIYISRNQNPSFTLIEINNRI